MTFDAIFTQGAFRPVQPVALPEGTRVQVSVHLATQATDPQQAAAHILAIAATTEPSDMPQYTSRNHDQVLYGPKGRM